MAARTTTRVPMPIKMRAKQFAMFDALKGLTEAIAEKEQQYYPKKEIAEDREKEINDVLARVQVGEMVQIVFYCQYSHEYKQICGKLNKIDTYWKELVVGKSALCFSEIYEINCV